MGDNLQWEGKVTCLAVNLDSVFLDENNSMNDNIFSHIADTSPPPFQENSYLKLQYTLYLKKRGRTVSSCMEKSESKISTQLTENRTMRRLCSVAAAIQ